MSDEQPKRQPRFCVTKTLLGGDPDVNRRYIRDTAYRYDEALGFNIQMKTWTAQHNRILNTIAEGLNALQERHPDVVDDVVMMLKAAIWLTRERL